MYNLDIFFSLKTNFQVFGMTRLGIEPQYWWRVLYPWATSRSVEREGKIVVGVGVGVVSVGVVGVVVVVVVVGVVDVVSVVDVVDVVDVVVVVVVVVVVSVVGVVDGVVGVVGVVVVVVVVSQNSFLFGRHSQVNDWFW